MQKDRAGEPFGTQMPAPETSFFAAAATVAAMPEVEERAEGWRQLATLLVGMPDEFRATAYRSHPELENARPYPDTDLSAAEQDLVSLVDQSDLEAIDQALVDNSEASWRTVARVIGGAMVTLEARLPSVPLGLYVHRIAVLVERRALLARGDIDFMRLSEVRLSPPVKDA
jgi:hypothetical protein